MYSTVLKKNIDYEYLLIFSTHVVFKASIERQKLSNFKYGSLKIKIKYRPSLFKYARMVYIKNFKKIHSIYFRKLINCDLKFNL